MKRICFVLLFLFLNLNTALADTQVPLNLLEEDVGNGYRYEAVGVGTFSANGKDYETLPAAVIDFETEMEAVLYADGEEIPFEEGDLIIDQGVYELYLYRTERNGGLYGIYHFTIENDFEEFFEQTPAKTEVAENPPLVLGWEPETGMFTYTLPNGESFQMNVPLGGTAGQAARILLSDGLTAYTMKKDGEAALVPEGLVFREPGHYELTVMEKTLGIGETVTYRAGIWFTLKSAGPEAVSLVNAPYGFSISSVRLDGSELAVSNSRAMVLKTDGTYEFSFTANDGFGAVWADTIIRDTAPPALTFETEVDGKVLTKDVAFLPPGRGERMQILCNGQEAKASLNRISQNGSYRITIWDAAGNSREYRFIMKQGTSFAGKQVIIVLIVLLLAAGAVMVYWRRNMRVI